MKKEKFLILGVVLTLFTMSFVSCLDDDDNNPNILDFVYEPVIIKSNDGSSVKMRTQYGDILAPQLNKAKAGEYYLTHFWMDTTQHPYTASIIDYKRMGADTISILPSGTPMTKASDISITDVGIYTQDAQAETLLKSDVKSVKFMCMDSTFFVKAQFDGSENGKSHDLELVFALDSIDATNHLPIFYLRAKPTDQEIARDGYALNLSPLIGTTLYAGEGFVEFNLKFKTGVDKDGKDVYKSYENNPVKLQIKKN